MDTMPTSAMRNPNVKISASVPHLQLGSGPRPAFESRAPDANASRCKVHVSAHCLPVWRSVVDSFCRFRLLPAKWTVEHLHIAAGDAIGLIPYSNWETSQRTSSSQSAVAPLRRSLIRARLTTSLSHDVCDSCRRIVA